MFRKTLFAIAAAGTLALGLASAPKPAEAGVVFQFGTGYGYGYYPRHHGYFHHGYGRCGVRTVRVRHHHRWVYRKVRFCNRYYGY